MSENRIAEEIAAEESLESPKDVSCWVIAFKSKEHGFVPLVHIHHANREIVKMLAQPIVEGFHNAVWCLRMEECDHKVGKVLEAQHDAFVVDWGPTSPAN